MKYFIIILSLLFATAVEARGHRITACYEEIDIINYIYYFRSSDIGSLDELFQSKKMYRYLPRKKLSDHTC